MFSKFLRYLRLFLHRGVKYTCPFCNYSARDLYVIGLDLPVFEEKQVVGGGKRFGGCYKCDSLDRERLVYLYLREKLRIFDTAKNKKILHIAPEENLSKELLAYGFEEYVCGDLFTEGYTYPKHVQNINILEIPYADNWFDLILCNHVLEHIPHDAAALKELYRVLKTGGKAILQVPISKTLERTLEDSSITKPEDRERAYGQADHVRLYGQDYTQRLQSAGFAAEKVNISREFSHCGLNPKEDIFVVSK